MRLLRFVLLGLSLFSLPSLAQSLVIEHVTVLPMDENIALLDQTVLIENGVILQMGTSVATELLTDVPHLDGRGRFLLPGFADMHAHLPGENHNGLGNQEYLALQLAAGVTTVRAMRFHESLPPLRQAIRDGKLQAPRLYLTGPEVYSSMELSLEAVDPFVAEAVAQGFDLIKVLSVKSPELYTALVEAAKKKGIRVAGHVPNNVGLERALALGQSSIEHLMGYDSQSDEVCAKQIGQTVEQGIFNCPTLDWYFGRDGYFSDAALKARPGVAYVPQALRDAWAKDRQEDQRLRAEEGPAALALKQEKGKTDVAQRLKRVKQLYEAGALLLVGPDATGLYGVPGFAMVEEMKLFAAAGLPNYAILKAATYNAAAYFGETDTWGSVRPGRRADFVLLEKDPRQDIASAGTVAGVVLGGRWIPTAELLRRLSPVP